ncbi:2-succinyl-5-enolpyruvyl-6-hydroxy-3-cyclohexene-1-carboxylic-acid synthase [Psychromonas sp. RZ22]|uniref:2-succinyl-5-enolpyruvyl-6-hydroxy-3- cyclohexene-1-carboxylic-acid synthase n=1 Tax=Psychromonas algarum TaxID=2555643 RepID=UPI00106877BE|nr:2-succinyl-5-enolpyruvyl-6-hydroxy-3-cyclohexene-1-carboxylic-acid synthase [Psychromonas sp. RZ22]TEW53372.1 2-succinyl-5-enolpyruvyl-6-hydroxy-3-cyclohexene-1-carboxylic-acid synthase [Psychromonas sp. RZ22]
MTQVDKQYAFPDQHHNINLLWANLFIEELIRHDIDDFCIAPGSRSTPFTLAAANHPKAKTHIHFDERGLGFLALGLSKAKSKPVVIITTSGTAVANLYPAVIEAKQSHIPLIVISADRPPELINCAANQAIEQYKIFADYPVFFAQIPSPSISVESNFLLTTLDQGLFQQQSNIGPIHFNMAIPEPFYPAAEKTNFTNYLSSLKDWLIQDTPFTIYHSTTTQLNNQPIDIAATKVLVIVGRIKDKKEALEIQQFCQQFQLPLFADVQSHLQGTEVNSHGYDLLLENEQFKNLIQQADLILQFSDHLISKRLNQFIKKSTRPVWLISEHKNRIDASHCIKQRFVCGAATFIKQVINSKKIYNDWLQAIQTYQATLEKVIKPYLIDNKISEINSSTYLLNQSQGNIVLGNSLAIRLADMFAQSNATIFSNRGASGIDGLIATAAGIAKNSSAITNLLIGDTSFLYDLNSLTLLNQLQQPFVIVLLNNDGGGIFNLLPVPAAHQQQFYQLPHGLNFQQICDQFSINYYQPKTFSEFQKQYQNAIIKNKHNKVTLIEVCVDNQLTPIQLSKIKDEVKNAAIQ